MIVQFVGHLLHRCFAYFVHPTQHKPSRRHQARYLRVLFKKLTQQQAASATKKCRPHPAQCTAPCLHADMYCAGDSKSSDALFEHLSVTLLQQSHLCPLPLEKQPIYWQHDHALRLYPVPSAVILADSSTPAASFTFEGCVCFNPVSTSSRPEKHVTHELLHMRDSCGRHGGTGALCPSGLV